MERFGFTGLAAKAAATWMRAAETEPSSFVSNLVSFQGNRAYFIKLGGDSPVTLNVTGRPLRPVVNWQPQSFNLFAPLVDPSDPPTFEEYFAPSRAHAGQPVGSA